MNRGDCAVGPAEHLHPGFLLNGLTGTLRSLGGAYALLAYLFVSGKYSTAILGIIGLLIFVAIGTFIYWRRFEFRIGADEIRIDSGVLSRTHRSIPFDRIQDVDITQGPVARLLGLAKVTFETGGGSALTGKEEGVLQAITLERAEEIRRLVRARRGGAPTLVHAAEDDQAEPEPVYAMNLRRLLLAGTFNFSLALFAGLVGLTQTFGDFLGFDPFSRSFWNRVLSEAGPLRDYVLSHQVAVGVAGLVVLVLLGVITGIVRTTIRDFGFRLDRTGVGLRRRRGLFTRTDVTIPARRAQAAILASGPIRDRLGYRELRLQSLARDEEGSGNHVLAPLATEEEARRILDEMGWRPLPAAIAWEPVSRAYFWKFSFVVLPLLIPAAVAQMVFAPLLGLSWLTVPTILLLARHLEWKRMGFAVDGDRLLLRSGWLKRRITVLPRGRIQSIDLNHSVVTRSFGTASLQFGVAGGHAFGSHSIPDIPRGRARELRDQLLGIAA